MYLKNPLTKSIDSNGREINMSVLDIIRNERLQ